MLRKLSMTPVMSDRLSMELFRRRRQPVNLIEQGLRRNWTSQKIFHQRWRIAFGSKAKQVFLQPPVPARIAGIEGTRASRMY
jgi:hypothetical protein